MTDEVGPGVFDGLILSCNVGDNVKEGEKLSSAVGVELGLSDGWTISGDKLWVGTGDGAADGSVKCDLGVGSDDGTAEGSVK